jgi:hypothetical protein
MALLQHYLIINGPYERLVVFVGCFTGVIEIVFLDTAGWKIVVL